jgi:hypothetical protein
MITKKILERQLFVYYNGRLIYKRWFDSGYGMIFDLYGLPWTAREVEQTQNKNLAGNNHANQLGFSHPGQ